MPGLEGWFFLWKLEVPWKSVPCGADMCQNDSRNPHRPRPLDTVTSQSLKLDLTPLRGPPPGTLLVPTADPTSPPPTCAHGRVHAG